MEQQEQIGKMENENTGKPAYSLKLRTEARFYDHSAWLLGFAMTVLYALLAVVALAPNPVLGKNSPLQGRAYRIEPLRKIIDFLGLDSASYNQIVFISIVLVLAIIATYIWAIKHFRRKPERLRTIVAITVIICLLMVFIPPLASKDLFSNIFYGKISAEYGENPYIVSPQKFVRDPLMPFTSVNWKNTEVVYAPLFTLTAAGLNKIAGDGLIANMIVFKLAMMFFHLANILLIWAIMKKINYRRQGFATMLYAWNPLVVLHSVGGAHNDVMMMTFVLLAMLLFLKHMNKTAFAMLSLSVMIKYITAVILFMTFIYLIQKHKSIGRIALSAAKYGLIFIIICVLLFAPFWEGPEIFRSTFKNLEIINHTNLSYVSSSILKGFLQGTTGISTELAETISQNMIRFIMLILMFALILKGIGMMKGPADFPDAWSLGIAAYLITTAYLLPWYLIWLIPILVLRKWDKYTKIGIGTSMASLGLACDFYP